MILIAITSPEVFSNPHREADQISCLLNDGVFDYVHLRKPGIGSSELSRLLAMIPESLHNRLCLHECYELTEIFGLGGIHLKSSGTSKSVPVFNARGERLRLSKSMHSIEEINKISPDNCYDYISLSPIYDSISKVGYTSRFSLDNTDLKEALASARRLGTKVVALGGVLPSKLSELSEVGFDGAMMLGYIWNNPEDFGKIIDTIKNIKRCYNT